MNLSNWVDPRNGLKSASQDFETIISRFETDRTFVDCVWEEFHNLDPNSVSENSANGYMIIEFGESSYYLVRKLLSDTNVGSQKCFVGKLVVVAPDRLNGETQISSLYGRFDLQETPLDPQNSDTDYETELIPDGWTLLHEDCHGSEHVLTYRHISKGTTTCNSPSLVFTFPTRPKWPSRLDSTPHKLLLTFQVPHSEVLEKLSANPQPHNTIMPANPQKPSSCFESSLSSTSSSTFTVLTNPKPHFHEATITLHRPSPTAAQSLTFQIQDPSQQSTTSYLIDAHTGRYVSRDSQGFGQAYLHFGTLTYHGQVDSHFRLQGIGQL